MANTKEVWKKIRGFAGKYEVSNKGKVRSLYFNYGHKRKTPHILSPVSDGVIGYLSVCLSKDTWQKWHSLSRLVAKTFLPKIDKRYSVVFKDGNVGNCRAANLAWATPENLHRYCKTNKYHKLKLQGVRRIRKLRSQGNSLGKIAEKYGVTRAAISNIVRGLNYKWVK